MLRYKYQYRLFEITITGGSIPAIDEFVLTEVKRRAYEQGVVHEVGARHGSKRKGSACSGMRLITR